MNHCQKSFSEVAAEPDYRINLAEAALLIAADEYPELSVASYLKRLDSMAAAVAERLPNGADPWQCVSTINDFLFHQRQFRGNVDNYYDPRNSFLNEVMDRRLGIPITLSTIYIEIARRVHLPVYGVNMPGHFVVRYFEPGVDLFVDPFSNGRVLTTEDCHEMILSLFRGRLTSFHHYLEPVSNRVILTRMLTNLKLIYLNQNDAVRATRVLDRIITLNPASATEYKERALLHLAAQRHRAALCDFISYLTNAPQSPDIDAIHHHIDLIITELHRNS